MTTRVHFTHLSTPDRIDGIVQLLLRRNRLTPRVLIVCPDDYSAQQIDDRLWSVHPEAFLAHARADSPNLPAADQPILIATTIVRDNRPSVLINAGLELPPDLNGFDHIVDFVDGWDSNLTQIARERWRTYISLGFKPAYFGNRGEQ
ncbi:MAG: DNA polymerase III subunit chi [Mariprofundales bacterium]|nr:DNA polymerase III subunit chi [Mariprofundales bacterium]